MRDPKHDSYNLGISLIEDNFILKVKYTFTGSVREFCLCNNITLRMYDEYSIIVASIASTSKECLFELLKITCYNTVVGLTDRDKEIRNQLFAALKDAYSNYYNRFYTLMKQRLSSKTLSSPDKTIYECLYEHQKEGALLGCTRRHNLFAFQQGLGKTITSTSVSLILDNDVTLILCPAIAKYNWYEELTEKWGISKAFITLVDSKKTIQATSQQRYIIVNYDMLKDAVIKMIILACPTHIIMDECQNIKNVKSARYKRTEYIVSRTGAKVSLLSGTPIKNRVNDMFAYLKLVGHPLGASYSKFLDRFTRYTMNQRFGGAVVRGGKDLDELASLCSNFIIRRTKDDCLDLPKKIYYTYKFALEEYKAQYDAELHEFVRLAQAKGKNTDVALSRLLIITAKAKIAPVIELAERIMENDEKVIIFGSYKEPFFMLENHFKDSCVKIDGSVEPYKRQALQNEFKNNPKIKVLLGQYQAAGTAINLVNSCNVILLSPPLTFSEVEQAEDRLHRIGQVRNVNIYYTICQNSIEEAIFELIMAKRRDAQKVLDKSSEELDFNFMDSSIMQEVIAMVLSSSNIQKEIEAL